MKISYQIQIKGKKKWLKYASANSPERICEKWKEIILFNNRAIEYYTKQGRTVEEIEKIMNRDEFRIIRVEMKIKEMRMTFDKITSELKN